MERDEKQQAIHDKGFSFSKSSGPDEYGKIKVGVKTLEDATIDLGALKRGSRIYADKDYIMQALARNNVKELRAISNYFYRTNGIYQKTCNYLASIYRFDWYVTPEVYDESVAEEKVIADFNKVLNYLDNSYVTKICSDIMLNVILNGAYYAYVIKGEHGVILQELPIEYCRTLYNVGNLPVVEFNMAWFDTAFPDPTYRAKILKMFPKDIQKGYVLYQKHKLENDHVHWATEQESWAWGVNSYNNCNWYPLEPGSAIKFSITNVGGGAIADLPWLVNAIPSILDLDEAQELNQKKMMQQLSKIIVQTLPINKNGDLIFDIDEGRDLHNNAVAMLRHTIGTDVLTTFADIKSVDLAENGATDNTDGLESAENTVYNALGISKNLFNTSGNLSLEKSILADVAAMRPLLLQFRTFFDKITQERVGSSRRKYNFRFYMLETTPYNYKDLAKMYKEQTQIGFSKMLPQIAMGHSQSSIINTAFFENNVLHLYDIMIPPLMSSVMSSESVLANKAQSDKGNANKSVEDSNGTKQEVPAADKQSAGRPEKAEGEKSDKTLANQESKS